MAAAILGKPGERMGNAHLLARRAEVQTYLEIQPVRAGVQFPIHPPGPPIELGDQHEPTIIRRIQLTGQFGDLRFQFFERNRCADCR